MIDTVSWPYEPRGYTVDGSAFLSNRPRGLCDPQPGRASMSDPHLAKLRALLVEGAPAARSILDR